MTDSTLQLGQAAPDFALPATNGETLSLHSLRGKNVVLYFYPKDNTPGCILEGCGFRDHYEEFQQLNTVVLGVSRDSLKAHDKFKEKYKFPFELLADEEKQLCAAYGTLKIKNMFGRQVNGINRSTFLIDKDGILRGEWRSVSSLKTGKHIQEVLAAIKEL
ncbi:peroxiredoxin [soil metagenome]